MNKYKKDMWKFIAVAVAFLILIICYFFFNKSTDNYNNLKIDSSKELVYTESQTQYDYYYQYKPYLNIKDEIGILVNNDIDEFMGYFNSNNIGITYEYDLSGKVLSLIIKVEDHSYAESATILYFRSYNINLGTLELLDNDTLFDYFDITSEDADIMLDNQIENYYNTLVENNLIKSCNYECFLTTRHFVEGLENISYFVKDSKLYAYVPYTYMSLNAENGMVYDFEIA